MTTRAAALPAAALLLLLSGCASTAAPASPPVPAAVTEGEVTAVRASASPIVDGRDGDAVWAFAPETVVPLLGVAGPASCRVRAAVHRGTLFLLVQWEDDTEDRVHKPWVAGADGAWASGPEREDVLSVAFALEGPFTANMLSPVDAVWDVWHWKAGRTDSVGHAMDRVHRMTLKDPGGRSHAQTLPDGYTVFIQRPEDAGDSVTEELPAPAAGSSSPSPRYRARRPSESAADVLARGTWNQGVWTLEMARALDARNADDRDFVRDADAGIPFAIGILDRAEDEDHAVSGMLVLRLPAWERAYFDPGEYWLRPADPR